MTLRQRARLPMLTPAHSPSVVSSATEIASALWPQASVILATTLGAYLLWKRPAISGTTLVAPWAWALATVATVGAVEAWAITLPTSESGLSRGALRYFAASLACCPVVAVLGAKRPQDRAWQWTVLSLWGVLTLPLWHTVATGGEAVELTGLWRLFFVGLCAMTLLCYGPSRNRWASLAAMLGQACLLAPFAWPDAGLSSDAAPAAGLACFAASALSIRRYLGASKRPIPGPLQRWQEFLDGWGAFWTVRLAARVNQTAELQRWPVRASVTGFYAIDEAIDVDALPSEQLAQIDATLDSLLWRFERHVAQDSK
ncbi:MAG: hypothetical protein KDA61_02185 [Planctomycetales bacterium]|nr:hypothetical protein [Planctomycetales bacterium]